MPLARPHPFRGRHRPRFSGLTVDLVGKDLELSDSGSGSKLQGTQKRMQFVQRGFTSSH
jgi:hypothetical protein